MACVVVCGDKNLILFLSSTVPLADFLLALGDPQAGSPDRSGRYSGYDGYPIVRYTATFDAYGLTLESSIACGSSLPHLSEPSAPDCRLIPSRLLQLSSDLHIGTANRRSQTN